MICICFENRLLFEKSFKQLLILYRYRYDLFNEQIILKHLQLALIGGLLLFWLTGCDDISSSSESGASVLQSLTIQPSTIRFDENVSLKDTTISIDIEVSTTDLPPSPLSYSVDLSGELVSEGELNSLDNDLYGTTLELFVNTGQNRNFTVYIYEPDRTSGDRLQGSLRVRGRNVSPPVIEEAFNTEEVSIPESGNERIDFFARVVHPDDQEFIDQVTFFLVDQGGNQLGEDFEMFDDGVFSGQQGFVDETASDSLYSRAFFINSGNSPDNVSVFYYATGIDGQSSDTLQTELRIIE